MPRRMWLQRVKKDTLCRGSRGTGQASGTRSHRKLWPHEPQPYSGSRHSLNRRAAPGPWAVLYVEPPSPPLERPLRLWVLGGGSRGGSLVVLLLPLATLGESRRCAAERCATPAAGKAPCRARRRGMIYLYFRERVFLFGSDIPSYMPRRPRCESWRFINRRERMHDELGEAERAEPMGSPPVRGALPRRREADGAGDFIVVVVNG